MARLIFRRRPRAQPQGPICRSWEGNGPGQHWDDCLHGSCWAIVMGK